MSLEASISFDEISISDLIERVIKDIMFEDDRFARQVAEEIDQDDIADKIAGDTDWEDISDIIYDKIQYNNLHDIACHLRGDLSEFLMEGEEFSDLVYSKIDKAISEDLKNRLEEMNNTINSQAIAIAQLTKTIDSMQTKKFWKKLGKK